MANDAPKSAAESKAEKLVKEQLFAKDKMEKEMERKDLLSQIEKEKKQIQLHLERAKQLESDTSYAMALRLIEKDKTKSSQCKE